MRMLTTMMMTKAEPSPADSPMIIIRLLSASASVI